MTGTEREQCSQSAWSSWRSNEPAITLVVWSISCGAEGEPLAGFRTQKVQALLIYLAAEGDTRHRREQLMTLLWPGMLESSGRANLRQVLYHLRRALGDIGDDVAVPLVIAERHSIRLNPEAGISVDIAQFDAELAVVHAHDHVELLTCASCYQTLETVVSL
jgi:DNA-binding SARP family transcriptional activator